MPHRILLAGALALAATGAAAQAPDDVYTLGELQVTARDRQGATVGGAVIGTEDLRRFDKTSVDRALDLIPGVAASATGGSRNEGLVFVRGFDRLQTTLSIDGVRVFLPADNRIDFSRFLTADLAQVQVSKGYVSVLDGPGGLGGAINLVTRKPAAPFEAEMRAGVGLDADGTGNSYTASGRLGFNTGRFYGQVSGARAERDHWALPGDFTPTALENGGFRDNSATDDWRVNAKVGFTPNDTDEYSLTYTRQEGTKNAPYHVNDTASTRFWKWPYWEIGSLAFLSRTQVAENASVRLRLYRNSFDNLLSAYDNARQNTQTLGRAFNSYYADRSYGGNAELAVDLSADNTLKAAAFYRRDRHVEWQQGFPSGTTEPRQATIEATTSLALEDTQRIGRDIDLILGVSRDHRNLIRAEEYNANTFVFYPTEDDSAWNGQASLVWRPDDATRLHASISSRTRFPTLFERFSSRFGTAIPNPGVKAERATSYEVGARFEPALGGLTLEGAVFYNDLKDALIQVVVPLGPPFGNTNQTRNAGKGRYYGAEASATWILGPDWLVGGNYTWLHRKLVDPTTPAFRPTGAPTHKLFAYAEWRPNGWLTLTPSVEAASDRWTVTAIAPPRYYRTGRYVLANLAAAFAVTPRVDLVVSGRNLLDASYQLVDGFPEEGRSFRADIRMRF